MNQIIDLMRYSGKNGSEIKCQVLCPLEKCAKQFSCIHKQYVRCRRQKDKDIVENTLVTGKLGSYRKAAWYFRSLQIHLDYHQTQMRPCEKNLLSLSTSNNSGSDGRSESPDEPNNIPESNDCNAEQFSSNTKSLSLHNSPCPLPRSFMLQALPHITPIAANRTSVTPSVNTRSFAQINVDSVLASPLLDHSVPVAQQISPIQKKKRASVKNLIEKFSNEYIQ